MARPRKFGHIQYGKTDLHWSGGVWDPDSPYVPTEDEAPFIHGQITWTDAQRAKWRREVGIFQNQPKQGLFVRAVANPTQPFGVVLVLDALMRLDPRCEIVAGELARLMNEQYAFFRFNDVSTGRILTGLTKEAQDQPSRPDHGLPALDSSSTAGTTYYIIEPDRHSWMWLANQREWWAAKAREWMDHMDRHGRWPDKNPWDEIDDMPYGQQNFQPADSVTRRRR